MIQPYYADSWSTIYHGDCRDILPALTLPRGALILTDPPYHIGYKPKYGRRKTRNGFMAPSSMPEVDGDDAASDFDPAHLLALGVEMILWGANHYAQALPRGQWLIWDKRCQLVPQRAQADCEIAWRSKRAPDRIFYHLWDGMVRASERGQSRIHPTQKPLALMRWCIALAGEQHMPGLIVDPYMGSGTTLRAAKDMGIRSVGIETSEHYCRRAAQRQAQETLWSLFDQLPGDQPGLLDTTIHTSEVEA